MDPRTLAGTAEGAEWVQVARKEPVVASGKGLEQRPSSRIARLSQVKPDRLS